MHRVLAPLTDIGDQRSLVSYLAALLFAIMSVAAARLIVRRRRIRFRALARFLLPRSVFLHRSSLVDYRLWLINFPAPALIAGGVVVGADVWAHAVHSVIGSLAVPVQGSSAAGWPLIVAIAALQLCAIDFGYWLGHVMMHRSPLLWELHKVHHSAEVMTFATEYRQHPLELVLMPSVIAVTTGTMLAVTEGLFGKAATDPAQFLSGAVFVIHLATFHHLRHSHVGVAFTGWAGRLLLSPAHHRIHHSANPAHFDTNFGFLLSLWDWLAGTLVMPVPGQRLTLGIGPEGAEHASVRGAFVQPLVRIGTMIASALRRTWPSRAAG